MRSKLTLPVLILFMFLLTGPAEAAWGEKIVYGYSGEGQELTAYRYGTGRNVLVMGFAIHGFEDNFHQDGAALVLAAQRLMTHLESSELPWTCGWTVYVLPCMNPDGLYKGWTNNGPGRCTTTYIDASGQLVKGTGIDMNRCFPTGFRVYSNSRNFTSTQPMACLEAQALSAFIQQIKGTGANVLMDVHGWYQQTISTSERILQVMRTTFPDNLITYSNSSPGYLTTYAHGLGYETCLLELPQHITSMQSFLDSGCVEKIVASVDGILRSEPSLCAGGHTYATISETPATCTHPGRRSMVCSVCGQSQIEQTVSAGHVGDAAEIVSEPTATQPGQMRYDCLACGLTITELIPSTFRDVPAAAYYAGDLDYCYAAGIIRGVTDDRFGPAQSLSRAMLTTLLYRFHRAEETGFEPPFTDLDEGAYYADAVGWACEAGIVTGVTADTFAPYETVTRQQTMTILHRYVRYLELDSEGQETVYFADSQTLREYAREAAQWSVTNGIIRGDDTGHLRPDAPTTRAQVVIILHRLAEYVEAYSTPEAV